MFSTSRHTHNGPGLNAQHPRPGHQRLQVPLLLAALPRRPLLPRRPADRPPQDPAQPGPRVPVRDKGLRPVLKRRRQLLAAHPDRRRHRHNQEPQRQPPRPAEVRLLRPHRRRPQ